ncbi:hypothetical protein PILCRDRAFT_732501 [Piloderma croceum F 1598]|uniref:Uncharacterized protein n=1 Tax=Piloderma croceum (strain F 1598) TaxID=765440 RepID=A0A0C3EKP4_PILCF|nr:hypothetical protein PILCRDRAFT_732501 [Piloderma croceum F 1598]
MVYIVSSPSLFVQYSREQHLQTFGQQIQITGSYASQPALERNFSSVTEEYGSVHAATSLGSRMRLFSLGRVRDIQLSQEGCDNDLGITNYDFHSAVRHGGHDNFIRDLWRLPLFSLGAEVHSYNKCC